MQADSFRPLRCRCHSGLAFPTPETFPGIYAAAQPAGASGGLGVCAELRTSKAVAHWAARLESQTKWLVGREDREEFCNGLHEIREAYVPDYDSFDEELDD